MARTNNSKEYDLLTSLDTLLRCGQGRREYLIDNRGFISVGKLLRTDQSFNSNMENTNLLSCVWGQKTNWN